jgi:hypothetical protein
MVLSGTYPCPFAGLASTAFVFVVRVPFSLLPGGPFVGDSVRPLLDVPRVNNGGSITLLGCCSYDGLKAREPSSRSLRQGGHSSENGRTLNALESL